jgi:hypothetical protein
MDTIHWMPPMYALTNQGPQYIYLTTSEIQPFPVTIHDGAGHLVHNAVISSSQPFVYKLSDTYSQLLVPDAKLQKAIKGYGLVMHGPKPFYAFLRAQGEDLMDACQLTCKGRAALGRTFRIANMWQVTDKAGVRSNFVGVMATEDSTRINLSGFDPLTIFSGDGAVLSSDGSISLVLQRGQSAVFAHYVGGIEDDQPRNGLMGSLLTATRPVAVSCGSWMGGPVVFQVSDIGMDEIVPLEKVGKEYILCRGGGPISVERPIIVAHFDDTEIWLNGDSTPVATLNAGKYLVLPTISYSANKNLYIRSTKPVFVYQMTGGVFEGFYSLQTPSLMFIPPLNCGISNQVSIYQPALIAKSKFDCGLTVVALRDSAVDVRIDGAPVDIGPPSDVPGNRDFVTYRSLDLINHHYAPVSGNLTVQSGGPVQVTLMNRFQPAGFAAFLSGFESRAPEVHLKVQGDGICPDTLVATGYFTGLKWIYEDSVIQFGKDTFLVISAPGPYKAVAYTGACFQTATVADSIVVPLTAPKFQYTFLEPSCFGFVDGQISLGTIAGGTPPYQYSIDNGRHFSAAKFFGNLKAGPYRIVASDSSGCYNQPVHFQMDQPAALHVELVAKRLPTPLQAGDLVETAAIPDFQPSTVLWTPADSAGCADCLSHSFRPELTTWLKVLATDATGCTAIDSMLLLVDPRIFAPNVINPESFHGNDRFTLFSKDLLPIHYLLIFDRWGNEVFSQKDIFTNDADKGWNGRFRGSIVEMGVYAFIAEVEIEPGRVSKIKGSVALVR